ncbi:MAG: hypothetical protein E6J29_03860 [Chloroflexi bacterium]|nr:MAG: hypothetical protein E6J29_03860 [Chloroflexota bacterium]
MQWAQQTRDFTIRPGDPLRDEFIERLKGDDGCAFTDKQWTCFGDHRLAAAVLENMGFTEMAVIVFNVPRRDFNSRFASS